MILNMYDESGCFDPHTMAETPDAELCQVALPPPSSPPIMAAGGGCTSNSHTITTTTNNNNNINIDDHLRLSAEELSLQLQNQLAFNAVNLMQDSSNNWDPNNNLQEMSGGVGDGSGSNNHQNFSLSNSLQETAPYLPMPELLNLLQLPPGCSASSSLLPNPSISFTGSTHNAPPLGLVGDIPVVVADSMSSPSILYDPLLHLNLPPQPPSFRDLFQSLQQPHVYTSCLPGSRGGSGLFAGGMEEHRESGVGGIYQDGDLGGQQFDNGVLEFSMDVACAGKKRKGSKATKHFVTEHQRRKHMNDKYHDLRSLVPNPTKFSNFCFLVCICLVPMRKTDRASIVREAIDYIKELIRTVNELKLLVEKKRYNRERNKRQKKEEDNTTTGDVESSINYMDPVGDPNQSYVNGSLRSSWLQRKSKDTEVDVRIVEDDVTIKLVQRKKINCLLYVSKVLDELQLDLHHVAGGHIGDHYSFFFNTKIYDGSCVYASAIANKLIEVVDTRYASASSNSCY